MHSKRWLTAIVAVPLLIALISGGGSLVFTLLIMAVNGVALWEYFRIAAPQTSAAADRVIPLAAYVMGVLILWAAYQQAFQAMIGFVALNLILGATIALFCFKIDSNTPAAVTRQVLGSVYISIFLAHLVMLRNLPHGSWWIYFLLAVIFAGDTGAYYMGTYYGRHKLCQAVSPKKTVEGALGGLLANLIVGALFKHHLMPDQSWLMAGMLFIGMGIVGQIGDLFESQLKRVSGIKDSSTLLPGHGGFLDRIDALLFAAPVVYYFQWVFIS